MTRTDQFHEHLEQLSDVNRKEVLATTSGQIYLATQGVALQADRLRASESVVYTDHQSDAIFFVFALHRLILLLQLGLKLADLEHQPSLKEAIADLFSVAGDTQGARDVLSHLDEYLTGFGRNHARAGDTPLPWHSREGSRYTVRVGDYAIDVNKAEEAAHAAFAAALPLDL